MEFLFLLLLTLVNGLFAMSEISNRNPPKRNRAPIIR